jgi:hypothetical protein
VKLAVAALLATSLTASAQDAAQRALEQSRETLETERREQLQKKSAAEEAHKGIDKPVAERPRDQQACNGARTYYQSVCGSAHVPKSGNRRCAEADMLVRQSC